jgi:hypothetical protein
LFIVLKNATRGWSLNKGVPRSAVKPEDRPLMKSSPILFREESRPPRLLTWPLVFLCAAVIASSSPQWLHEMPQIVLISIVLGGTLCALLLLEFVALVIEVRATEVQFSFAPFYQRRLVTANIQHWTIRTDHSPTGFGSRLYSWRAPKHCVELAMRDGSIVTIMSAHPEQFSHAIGIARGPQ